MYDGYEGAPSRSRAEDAVIPDERKPRGRHVAAARAKNSSGVIGLGHNQPDRVVTALMGRYGN